MISLRTDQQNSKPHVTILLVKFIFVCLVKFFLSFTFATYMVYEDEYIDFLRQTHPYKIFIFHCWIGEGASYKLCLIGFFGRAPEVGQNLG